MPINLIEDWNRRFGAKQELKPEVKLPPPVKAKAKPEPKHVPEPESDESEEEEVELVVDRKVKSRNIKPETWAQNVEASTPAPIPTKPRSNRIREPVISGRRVYMSEGTANWGLVRAGIYPKYKEYCQANNITPDIREFNSLIAPQWKMLSVEDKAKAAANPEHYFTFE